MALSIVILAAGKGKRMHSRRPKVLQPLAGRPLLAHVLDTARALAPDTIHVVVGHGAEMVLGECAADDIQWVMQHEQLGTGHAVLQALPAIADGHTVLILYGDVPLVSLESLRALIAAGHSSPALLAVLLPDPAGYGRVLRDADGRVLGIVEEKDASPAQRAITEINTGMLAAPAELLRRYLPQVGNANAQGEYYLPDIIGLAVAEGLTVQGLPGRLEEALGVNDRRQLAELERLLQRRQAQTLLEQGVTLLDPSRIDIRGQLTCGKDVVIDVNVVCEGRVSLGDGVHIGANCYLRDCELDSEVTVLPFSHLEGARVGAGARIGPYARLRPGAELASDVHIGNFVEIKQAQVGQGSKINHLSYVGDATIGRGVNIGAGTITCNYDGANKHRTRIEDGAFIGSGTMLVAPISVGENATIGAGSAIREDAPAGKLTLTGTRQKIIEGWQRPVKKTKPDT